MIQDDNNEDQNLLTEHGFLTKDNVNVGVQERMPLLAIIVAPKPIPNR